MNNIFKSGSQGNTTSTNQGSDYYNRAISITPNPYEKLYADLSEIKAMLRNLLDNRRNIPEKHDLLDIKEACELLKISSSTIYKLTAKNQIPTIRRKGSKKLMFSRLELEKWLKESQTLPVVNVVDEYLNKNLRVKKIQNN